MPIRSVSRGVLYPRDRLDLVFCAPAGRCPDARADWQRRESGLAVRYANLRGLAGTPTRERDMMQIREIRQIRQRVLRAAALLGVLVATGAGMAAAPVTASASSMTPVSAAAPVAPDVVLPLTPTDPLKEGPGVDEAAHKCAIIGDKMFPNPPGSTNKVDAVHCADVFIVTIGGSTGNEVIVQNEVFCQWATGPRDGQTFPCSGVSEQVGAGSPQGTAALPAQLCGKIFGKTHSPCTSGRTQHAGFAFSYQPEPVLSAPAKCTFWGESLRVSAILPIKSPNHPLVNAVPLATNSRSVSSSTNARGYCLDV